MVTAKCHPDRRHMAHGLCNLCYKVWYKGRPGYVRVDRPRTPEEQARRLERRRERLAEGYVPPKRVRQNRDPLERMRSKIKVYGITLADYDAMLAAQDGRCAICGRPEYSTWRGKVRRLAIDHHHGSGKVRALLCTGCNLGLGAFSDSAERLREAADYLDRMS